MEPATATLPSAATATLTRTQARTLVDRAQRDPVWFITCVLGARLWPRQQEIARAVWAHRRTAVRSCNRSGKSYVAAHIGLAFLYAWPDSVVLTTAPTDRQVKGVLWQEIARAYLGAKVPLGGRLLQAALHVREGWFALGLTAKDPTGFQGINLGSRTLVIVDEAAGIDPDLWPGIEGILAGEHTHLLMIGNPTSVAGAFREEFNRPEVAKFRISAFDTPNFTGQGTMIPGLIAPEWVEERRQRWGESSIMWQARVLGEFPDSASDSLIPLSWLERARERECLPGEPNTLGVDVAFQGDDATVIVHRQGSVARIYGTYRQEDPMTCAGRIVQARRDTGATAIYVDSIGLGAGVVARLRELQEPVIGINVAERALDAEQFANRRAELYWGLRVRAQDGDLALVGDAMELDELSADLTGMRVPPPNSRGQIVLEPKAETKRRIQRSPDRGDALMLAFATDRTWAFDAAAIGAVV